jgi:Ca2+-binding EF-hand superfamily protein
MMQSVALKKHYKRFGEKVKQTYTLSKEEIKQKERITQLFNKFDTDGSGGLDTGELTELYN